jgi:hypothetical protein
MRPVKICACIIASLPVLMAAASMDVAPSHSSKADVTVVLDVKGFFSPAAMREMEKEAERILATSGIRLDWRTRQEALAATFNDLVVMTFNGSCTLDAAPAPYNESGPYAFTRTANGEIQPFGEVDCDHVAGSVRQVMFGDDYAHPDALIGRALGRVVAHELVHMITRSGQHGREGVEKAALSGRQLISASLPLSVMDIDRLRQRH